MRLERCKIRKFSLSGKGDTPFTGPYPPQPRPLWPRRILAPPWQKASCAYGHDCINDDEIPANVAKVEWEEEEGGEVDDEKEEGGGDESEGGGYAGVHHNQCPAQAKRKTNLN